MQQRTLIFGLLLAILLVIFALQNAVAVKVKLWFWEFESSLALVLLIALALGAILGILFSIPARRARKKTNTSKPEQSEEDEKIMEL